MFEITGPLSLDYRKNEVSEMLNSQKNNSLSVVCADRRDGRRQGEKATIEYLTSKGFQRSPVIESCDSGARVVLNDVEVGDTLDIVLKTKSQVRDGEARVAWIKRLGSGRAIAGLQFLNVTNSLAQSA